MISKACTQVHFKCVCVFFSYTKKYLLTWEAWSRQMFTCCWTHMMGILQYGTYPLKPHMLYAEQCHCGNSQSTTHTQTVLERVGECWESIGWFTTNVAGLSNYLLAAALAVMSAVLIQAWWLGTGHVLQPARGFMCRSGHYPGGYDTLEHHRAAQDGSEKY